MHDFRCCSQDDTIATSITREACYEATRYKVTGLRNHASFDREPDGCRRQRPNH